MTDMSKYTKSKWLKAEDVEAEPDQVLTIQKCYEHEFERDNTTKPVIEFLEIDQALTLNKTRVTALIDAFGPDGSKWVGKRVKLSTVPTSMGASVAIESAEDKPAEETEVSFD